MHKSRVEIQLKPAIGDLYHISKSSSKHIEKEYAAKYLELIGANPTKENMEMMKRYLPLSEAYVYPNWMNDTLIVVPDMAEYIEQSDNKLLMKDGFGSVEDYMVSKAAMTAKLLVIPESESDNNNSNSNSNSMKSNQKWIEAQKHLQKDTNDRLNSRRCSWGTAKTFHPSQSIYDRIDHEMMDTPEFHSMLYPPHIMQHLMLRPLHRYISNMFLYVPKIQDDNSGKLYDGVSTFLLSSEALQTYSLLIHYSYWNVIHPLVRRSILQLRSDIYSMENKATKKTGDKTSLPISSENSIGSIENYENDDELSLIELYRQLELHHIALEHGNDENYTKYSSSYTSGNRVIDRKNIDLSYIDQSDPITAIFASNSSNSSGVGDSLEVGNDNFSLTSLASEGSLSSFENEVIFMQLHHSLDIIKSKMGSIKQFRGTTHHAFVCCCHYIVDSILSQIYPWLDSDNSNSGSKTINNGNDNDNISPAAISNMNSDHFIESIRPPLAIVRSITTTVATGNNNLPDIRTIAKASLSQSLHKNPLSKDQVIRNVKLEIRRLIHQALADLIDPGRVFLSSMLLLSRTKPNFPKSSPSSSSSPSEIPSHRYQYCNKESKVTFCTTSLAIKAALSTSTSPDVIKIMRYTDVPYIPVPGYMNRHEPTMKGNDILSLGPSKSILHISQRKNRIKKHMEQSQALAKIFETHQQSSFGELPIKTVSYSNHHPHMNNRDIETLNNDEDSSNDNNNGSIRLFSKSTQSTKDLMSDLKLRRSIHTTQWSNSQSISNHLQNNTENISGITKRIIFNIHKAMKEDEEKEMEKMDGHISHPMNVTISEIATEGSQSFKNSYTMINSNPLEYTRPKTTDSCSYSSVQSARTAGNQNDFYRTRELEPEMKLSADFKANLIGMMSKQISTNYKRGLVPQQGKMKNPIARQKLVL